MRLRQAPVEDAGALPDVLARFRLDDWTDPADWTAPPSAAAQRGTQMSPEAERALFLRVRAYRRFMDARREWADARGMRYRDLPRLAGSR